MTEAEWFSSSDPEAMHEVVVNGVFRTGYGHWHLTRRKREFFGAACCRLVWPWVEIDERTRRWVEYTENQFDLSNTDDERVELEDSLLMGVKAAARHPVEGTPPHQLLAANLVCDLEDSGTAIRYLIHSFDDWGDVKERASEIAGIMRCIVSNPFRPVAFDPAWRTPTVAALADAIYADRAFDRLPVLADALEEAGCDHPDVLSHCRGDGPHVRGCWVVDLVLGKS
jgi:hypothetical protein